MAFDKVVEDAKTAIDNATTEKEITDAVQDVKDAIAKLPAPEGKVNVTIKYTIFNKPDSTASAEPYDVQADGKTILLPVATLNGAYPFALGFTVKVDGAPVDKMDEAGENYLIPTDGKSPITITVDVNINDTPLKSAEGNGRISARPLSNDGDKTITANLATTLGARPTGNTMRIVSDSTEIEDAAVESVISFGWETLEHVADYKGAGFSQWKVEITISAGDYANLIANKVTKIAILPQNNVTPTPAEIKIDTTKSEIPVTVKVDGVKVESVKVGDQLTFDTGDKAAAIYVNDKKVTGTYVVDGTAPETLVINAKEDSGKGPYTLTVTGNTNNAIEVTRKSDGTPVTSETELTTDDLLVVKVNKVAGKTVTYTVNDGDAQSEDGEFEVTGNMTIVVTLGDISYAYVLLDSELTSDVTIKLQEPETNEDGEYEDVANNYVTYEAVKADSKITVVLTMEVDADVAATGVKYTPVVVEQPNVVFTEDTENEVWTAEVTVPTDNGAIFHITAKQYTTVTLNPTSDVTVVGVTLKDGAAVLNSYKNEGGGYEDVTFTVTTKNGKVPYISNETPAGKWSYKAVEGQEGAYTITVTDVVANSTANVSISNEPSITLDYTGMPDLLDLNGNKTLAVVEGKTAEFTVYAKENLQPKFGAGVDAEMTMDKDDTNDDGLIAWNVVLTVTGIGGDVTVETMDIPTVTVKQKTSGTNYAKIVKVNGKTIGSGIEVNAPGGVASFEVSVNPEFIPTDDTIDDTFIAERLNKLDGTDWVWKITKAGIDTDKDLELDAVAAFRVTFQKTNKGENIVIAGGESAEVMVDAKGEVSVEVVTPDGWMPEFTTLSTEASAVGDTNNGANWKITAVEGKANTWTVAIDGVKQAGAVNLKLVKIPVIQVLATGDVQDAPEKVQAVKLSDETWKATVTYTLPEGVTLGNIILGLKATPNTDLTGTAYTKEGPFALSGGRWSVSVILTKAQAAANQEYVLTLNAGKAYSVTLNLPDGVELAKGETATKSAVENGSVTFNVTVEDGWKLLDSTTTPPAYIVDGPDAQGAATITVSNVKADTTVDVASKEITTGDITVTVSGNPSNIASLLVMNSETGTEIIGQPLVASVKMAEGMELVVTTNPNTTPTLYFESTSVTNLPKLTLAKRELSGRAIVSTYVVSNLQAACTLVLGGSNPVAKMGADVVAAEFAPNATAFTSDPGATVVAEYNVDAKASQSGVFESDGKTMIFTIEVAEGYEATAAAFADNDKGTVKVAVDNNTTASDGYVAYTVTAELNDTPAGGVLDADTTINITIKQVAKA